MTIFASLTLVGALFGDAILVLLLEISQPTAGNFSILTVLYYAHMSVRECSTILCTSAVGCDNCFSVINPVYVYYLLKVCALR